MAEGKKQRKYGRNSRRPGGGKNQEMRTARNKRLNIEKHGASADTFATNAHDKLRGKPKRQVTIYTSARASRSPLEFS